MKITKQWLNKKEACIKGVKWFLAQDEMDAGRLMTKLVAEGRGDDAFWLLENLKQSKKQSVQIAIFSAELVVENYENLYPDDDRPRKAIEAARAYLIRPNKATRDAARSAKKEVQSKIINYSIKVLGL